MSILPCNCLWFDKHSISQPMMGNFGSIVHWKMAVICWYPHINISQASHRKNWLIAYCVRYCKLDFARQFEGLNFTLCFCTSFYNLQCFDKLVYASILQIVMWGNLHITVCDQGIWPGHDTSTPWHIYTRTLAMLL